MRINDLTNLYVANYNDGATNFNVLTVALDEVEARMLAEVYFSDSKIAENSDDLHHYLTIKPFEDINTRFDCDYAIAY